MELSLLFSVVYFLVILCTIIKGKTKEIVPISDRNGAGRTNYPS